MLISAIIAFVAITSGILLLRTRIIDWYGSGTQGIIYALEHSWLMTILVILGLAALLYIIIDLIIKAVRRSKRNGK